MGLFPYGLTRSSLERTEKDDDIAKHGFIAKPQSSAKRGNSDKVVYVIRFDPWETHVPWGKKGLQEENGDIVEQMILHLCLCMSLSTKGSSHQGGQLIYHTNLSPL